MQITEITKDQHPFHHGTDADPVFVGCLLLEQRFHHRSMLVLF